MHVFADLKRRARTTGSVRVAVVGAGYFGAGVLRRMAAVPGILPAVVANRTLERAVAALQGAGIAAAIRVCEDVDSAQTALDDGLAVATSSLLLPAHLRGIDVVLETTGDMLVGVEVALEAIGQGKHVVAANTEVQATVGSIIKQMADEAGVVYSDVDGDQPGILKNLYDYCVGLGLTPIVAGNCKGVMKRYATPETQAAFATAHGLQPWLATAAADGTKLNFEMALVANATGMLPAAHGMVGPETCLETLLADFERQGLFSHGPIVEYTLGVPSGVFMIVHSEDPRVRADLAYCKMGDGPYFLVYRPYVLIHYEAPLSVAEAALYGAATIAPDGAPKTEVVAFAKRDLAPGTRLDGIGGADGYGLIVRADEARACGFLPMGLSAYARLRRAVARDQPVTYDDVVIEGENALLELRRRQDMLFAEGR
jgi:predicted homoserine dehydrogenase-like protein